MNLLKQISITFIILCAMSLCSSQTQAQVSIVPIPNHLNMGEGVYNLDASDMIVFSDDQIEPLAGYLRAQVYDLVQINLKIAQKELNTKGVNLSIDSLLADNEEAYTLDIISDKVSIVGASKIGLMHGIQSLLQVIFPNNSDGHSINLPALSIVDEPVFKWRGMHLDVSRHFYSVEFVKHMLDMMAMHKLNVFHWHLTDDQGWRIEIKKYPKLTEISSVRKETMVGHYVEENQIFDGTPYGGFYTQEQIKEVVDYASKLCITVVPEIEMPGHAVAALSAYPELSCTGGPFEVYTKWGVSSDVFCAGKEETFEFVQNVISEVVDLFPGKYIHVGGDECPKTRWKDCPFCQKRMKENGLKDEMELQSYFIKRMEKFIASKGKKLIGWDEILEGGLPERATVMSWRGYEGGIEAARSGHDVVMTPGGYCYFDHYQGKPETESLAIGGFTSLSKVYEFKPVPPELSKKARKHILGAQANVWTEYITTEDKVEYMVFPRLCAMSEVLWSKESTRDFGGFMKRLDIHLRRLDNEKVNYRPLDK
ncbi:MAG: beta-N-acetylhexosaminidase [Labilibaculum antarcticum]